MPKMYLHIIELRPETENAALILHGDLHHSTGALVTWFCKRAPLSTVGGHHLLSSHEG